MMNARGLLDLCESAASFNEFDKQQNTDQVTLDSGSTPTLYDTVGHAVAVLPDGTRIDTITDTELGDPTQSEDTTVQDLPKTARID